MNRKALLVLIPLFAMLSLLVMPALAQTDEFATVRAVGYAFVKTNAGCVSGCATLWVFAEAPVVVGVGYNYVILQVKDHTFYWRITSEKLKCNVITVCASPSVLSDGVSDGQVLTTLSPITVVVNLCKPYCVTAFGCSAFFIGQGHPLTPG